MKIGNNFRDFYELKDVFAVTQGNTEERIERVFSHICGLQTCNVRDK